jgi:hypothetical protein
VCGSDCNALGFRRTVKGGMSCGGDASRRWSVLRRFRKVRLGGRSFLGSCG